jgi:DNA-directed RNA polymerase specialized sigma24 family protein
MAIDVAPHQGAYAFFVWRPGTRTTSGVRIGDRLKAAVRLGDDELLRLIRDDAEAFGVSYRRHVRAVLSYLRREGLSLEGDALVLASEGFAAALLASRRYRPGEAPARAWLYGIARNKALQAPAPICGRGGGRAQAGDAAARLLGRGARAGRRPARGRDRRLTTGMAGLPPAERDAVVARVIEQRDYAEIAAASAAQPRGDPPARQPRAGQAQEPPTARIATRRVNDDPLEAVRVE